jgi:hypothetical protein
MNFEPQKFFIGLVDFFSILMPGAFLAYLGRDLDISMKLVPAGFRSDSVKSWVVFLFASYLLGHFIFLIGAKLAGAPTRTISPQRIGSSNCRSWARRTKIA